jgi:hypothetical protein
MGTDPGNFDRLHRLLVWKRHEKPPPGYFDALPDRIRLRLQQQQEEEGGVWGIVTRAFNLKPVLLGALGTAAFGLFFFGVNLAQWATSAPTEVAIDPYNWMIPAQTSNPATVAKTSSRIGISDAVFAHSSVLPPLGSAPADSWFNGQMLKTEPGSFHLPSR